MKFLTLASAVAVAFGSCPNQCSGHGRCGEDDKCICYTSGPGTAHPTRSGYFGVDCSLRTCPTGTAYDAISTASGSVSPISFVPAEGSSSEDYLRVYFVPSARHENLQKVPVDSRVTVKVMKTVAGLADFTWKFDTEEYFRKEQALTSFVNREGAFQLTDRDPTTAPTTVTYRDTGIFIWWDATKFQNDVFSSCITTAITSCVNPGDVYTFSVNVNHDRSFDAGDSNSAHQETECSGRGSCDFSSGKCACFDGFTGDACQRTVCPNACSGHGACQNELRFIKDMKSTSLTATKYSGAYDANQQYGCKCDSGYRGADCSLIECPSGEDPMGGDGGEEGRDCSGRGICDYSAGTCKCFKGFFGERCDIQTNFV